jgi:hypothetical protein
VRDIVAADDVSAGIAVIDKHLVGTYDRLTAARTGPADVIGVPRGPRPRERRARPALALWPR